VFKPVLELPKALQQLRKRSLPIDIDSAVASHIITDMHDTFRVLEGYGLAAPQIGIKYRVIIISPRSLGINDDESLLMLNPVLTVSGDKQIVVEACFSVPHVSSNVERFSECTVSYISEQGQEQTLELTGFPAACLQHEVDHLDGILYVDRMSRLKRSLLLKKIGKIKKRENKLAKDKVREFMEDHMSLEYKDDTQEKSKTTYSKKRKAKARRKNKRSK
jgi:peptide deformylase